MQDVMSLLLNSERKLSDRLSRKLLQDGCQFNESECATEGRLTFLRQFDIRDNMLAIFNQFLQFGSRTIELYENPVDVLL